MFFYIDDFVSAINDPQLAEELGTDSKHLFSYMMTGRYKFECTASAREVVSAIKRHTDSLFHNGLATQAGSHGLTKEEVLRLASVVAWETRVVSEKRRVAGVYLNRINRNWRLDADPTVVNAFLDIEGLWRPLLLKDYRIDHSYNTYRFKGFPPGPVANPGRTSLAAAANPEVHDYMFFVANEHGQHTFCEDYACHRRESRKLHNWLRT